MRNAFLACLVTVAGKRYPYDMGFDSKKTDNVLLDAWRGGCESAGQELLKRYYGVLYRFFANKVGSDADDLVQQSMTALLAGRERFEHRSSFRSYVLSIARYQLFEFVRRQRRSSAWLEYDSVSALDLTPSPSSLLAARRDQGLLLVALRRIPLSFQVALELHYWEDLSGPEIAEVLDVPVDTAYSRLRKARILLKRQLRFLATVGAPGASAAPLEAEAPS